MLLRKTTFLFSFLCISMWMTGQTRNPEYVRYIKQYGPIASRHQSKYKIPASITLAQGLLESGAGQGRLAREANNHFGIKCHDWDGKTIYHDDDERNECFRKYSHAEDSFHDHSMFLTKRDRYASLFKLDENDYKSWAKGLQKCGYATDPSYANKLIKLIEDYKLYEYDKKQFVRPVKESTSKSASSAKTPKLPSWYKTHDVYKNNDLLYVEARDRDTYELIAKELGFKAKKLRAYNEVPEGYTLQEGDVVYLEKKNKKGSKDSRYHTVKGGESMHSISQVYGIRLKNLYKINNKPEGYAPQRGDLLRLR